MVKFISLVSSGLDRIFICRDNVVHVSYCIVWTREAQFSPYKEIPISVGQWTAFTQYYSQQFLQVFLKFTWEIERDAFFLKKKSPDFNLSYHEKSVCQKSETVMSHFTDLTCSQLVLFLNSKLHKLPNNEPVSFISPPRPSIFPNYTKQEKFVL